MPTNPSDFHTNPSLLRRIKDLRDGGAWGEFDSLYRPMLHRFAKIRGLSDADAEDIVQRCMASICVHIDEFTYDPSRGRFKAWLQTLVKNKCRDLQRSRKHREKDAEALKGVAADVEPPESAFERIWVEEHLNHCLRLLSQEEDEQTYKAFHEYAVEEQPVEEVCRRFELTAQQLYKIKWRLTKRLREQMTHLVGEAIAASVLPGKE